MQTEMLRTSAWIGEIEGVPVILLRYCLCCYVLAMHASRKAMKASRQHVQIKTGCLCCAQA